MHRSAFPSLLAGAAVVALSANNDHGHARAGLLEHDTWFYGPDAPNGRLFAAGERHPGKGWGDAPSSPGQPAADEQSGEWGEKLSKALNDLEDQKETFDAAWAELSDETKRLEGQNADLTEKLGKAQADLDAANGEIAELKGQIAKFDPDGDGKPGGSVAKASK